jgi:DNA polymerase III subunit gamma/tau
MSDYQVIARKYRPQRFEEVVGQDHVTRTLSRAIEKNRIAHAYLFCGPRGTGKTTLARIFAKCLNCTDGPRTDFPNDDPKCVEISEGRSLDVMEIDGASNRGIDEIRELRDTVSYGPATSRYKIFIIDEVHMLTKEAFNALLKTLEEPPSHVKFMFATTEPDKVLPTILSRCQRFDLQRIASQLIIDHLETIAKQEGIHVEKNALKAIARGADGGMRDAQSTLDQLISFCGDQVEEADVLSMFGLASSDHILRLAEAIVLGDKLALLNELDTLAQNGKDLGRLLADLQEYFRHLLILKVSDKQAALEGLSEAESESLRRHAKTLKDTQVLSLLETLSVTDCRLREASAKRIAVEVGLIQAAESLRSTSIDEVISALKDLQQTPSAHQSPGDAPSAKKNLSKQPSSKGASIQERDPIEKAASKQAVAPEPPPPRTETQQVSSTSEINLHDVWSKLLARISKDNPFLHSYLAEGQALEINGRVITVGYPESQTDQLDMVDNRKNHDAIEEYLGAMQHTGLKIRFVKSTQLKPRKDRAGYVPPGSPDQTSTTKNEPEGLTKPDAQETLKVPIDPEEFLNDPLIKKALEIFKGRLLKVESST